ncbi:MAG: sulfatase [Pirellulales bacterium]
MTRFLSVVGLCLAYALVVAPIDAAEPEASTPVAKAKRPPNILFIAVDDLNAWVGHLGRNPQAKTPNIDRLAALGTTFTHAYCAAPVCNPSRAALMSGLRPSTSGVYENNIDWRGKIARDLTLNGYLHDHGYDATASGKIYHEAYDRDGDWDAIVHRRNNPGTLHPSAKNDGVGGIKFAPISGGDDEVKDTATTDWAIELLGRAKHDKPFFAGVGFHKPHMPWNVPKKYYDLYPLDKIELPAHRDDDLNDIPPAGIAMAKPNGDHKLMLESGRWKEAVQGYLASISHLDGQLGRVLDAYEKSPSKDDTIIVFWGDHGWHLGEKQHWRKFALWEEATRAPLIYVAPGLTKPGTRCDRPVDFMTIYPTLCELAGLPVPKHVEGSSIASLLADPTAAWDKGAITTHHFQNHAIRTEKWRYIRYANGDEELYDEVADPLEYVNLAGKPEHAGVKAELAKRLPTKNVPEVPTKGAAAGKNAGKGKNKAKGTNEED